MTSDERSADLMDAAASIVSAYVSNNKLSADAVPDLIRAIYSALASTITAAEVEAPAALTPAVPVRKSVTPDFIVSLEDGRKLKSLKRHLGGLGMTPEQYRAKWGLPSNYPMVAESYSAKRAEVARKNGLGRKAGEAPANAETSAVGPRKATRKKPT